MATSKSKAPVPVVDLPIGDGKPSGKPTYEERAAADLDKQRRASAKLAHTLRLQQGVKTK